jgi:hypothetical protein
MFGLICDRCHSIIRQSPPSDMSEASHDARHTVATVLLVPEIAERAVMGIMGWSDSGMTKRWQHLTAQVRRDVAERVRGLLWQLPTEAPDGPRRRGRCPRTGQLRP